MATTNSTLATTEQPVWFITGCSTGFGRELATHVLDRGYRTVVTARNPDEVNDLAAKGEALVLRLDVTDQGQIDAAITAAEEKFDRIDVLVNNAGIGYFAAVEESEEDQVRRMFEALWQEVEPLGIKVMLVEPSGFRTDWAGRSANESKRQIDDYAATAGVRRSQSRSNSGKQPGDPVRGAHAILKAIESPNPPHHLLLGNDAYEAATAKLEDLRKEFSTWEAVSRGADFPKETPAN